MFYYEYEYIVMNLIDILKEKQEAEEGAQKGQSENMNVNSAMKQAKSHLPAGMGNLGSGGSMPSMPSFPGIPSSLKI
jgi:hypothetical protein